MIPMLLAGSFVAMYVSPSPPLTALLFFFLQSEGDEALYTLAKKKDEESVK